MISSPLCSSSKGCLCVICFSGLKIPCFMLPDAAFFYLHDIEQADILHSTQKNWFSVSSAFPFISEAIQLSHFIVSVLLMFQAEHPSSLSPDIFTHYFSHHSKEDLIFMSDIKTTFNSRSMANSPSLWPTITCSELSCSRTTRYLLTSLPPCSTFCHQKFLLWRSPIPLSLASPLTAKPFF